MDTQVLLIIMAAFTAVAAISLAIQTAVIVGIYKSSRALQEKIETLAPKIHAVADNSLAAIQESKVRIAEITTKTGQILDSASRQVAKIAEITTKTSQILDTASRQLVLAEGLFADFSGRARNQMDRAEMVLDDAMSRVQETVGLVHGGIMKPIREINGVAAGVRAAIRYFARGGRPNPDRATADEEMFI
jgi:ABC-type transporter Mla subunit MlaD